MDATLCQLLARATQSPYFRLEGETIATVLQFDLGDKSLKDWLIQQALTAKTIENLSPGIRGFLADCDRSSQIQSEMFSGPVTGTQEERDRAVVKRFYDEAPEA